MVFFIFAILDDPIIETRLWIWKQLFYVIFHYKEPRGVYQCWAGTWLTFEYLLNIILGIYIYDHRVLFFQKRSPTSYLGISKHW